MPTIINCPHCGETLRASDQILGQIKRCPSCANAFRVTVAGLATRSQLGTSDPSMRLPNISKNATKRDET